MVIKIPGSKSYTNRALILAAQTKGTVTLKNPLYADDTEAMIACLRTLGIKIDTLPDKILVHGDVSDIQERHYELHARESGTTARFLLALLCIVPGTKILHGYKRPIGDLVGALRNMGAEMQGEELPLTITSSTLQKEEVELETEISSQFISALLLIGKTVHIKGVPPSSSYIEMTKEMLRTWKSEYTIEGDYSSACYFFAWAHLTHSKISIENLEPRSLQGDRKFLEMMDLTDVNMENCPDQVMTMAVIAAFREGKTHISGIRTLRFKECNRVLALQTELAKMGIPTESTEDTLTIYGGAPNPAAIETYNDHRIAMAFAIAQKMLPSLVIKNPEVVNKTFPNFWKLWSTLP